MSPNTHPIGPGTRNLSANMPVADFRAIGRESYDLGFRSMGAYVRELIRRGRYVLSAARIAMLSAECDARALREFASAQHPDSDGGENITPAEAATIAAHVRKSERLDRWQARSISLHATNRNN